jgi:acetyl esterase/lipase
MIRRVLLATLLVFSTTAAVRAADQTVLGASFIVRNPSTATKQKISAKAKEKATDDTIVGDPVANGATVTISANGGTSMSQTFTLPAGTNPATAKPFWSGDAVKGFKYSDPRGANGALKSAQIKSKNGVFQIKITVDGKLGSVAVLPPAGGTDGCVLLTLGGGDSYSVAFASGDVTSDGTVFFKVNKPTAEGSCVPTTTTTTVVTTTSTSSTTTTIPIPLRTPPGDAPLRYRDAIFANVTVTSNVTYGSAVNNSAQTVTLLLDVYEPTGDTITARPAIVWVHGGSFAVGDKTSAELVDEANVFAKKGYFNVSINYRLEPPGCAAASPTVQCVIAINEAWQDAQTAVRFLRTNAATYGIDPTRIAIGGSSAGAITALNVGFTSAEDPTASVAAAVSLSGGRLIGTPNTGDAPSMLFHGTADNIVPYSWATSTVSAATAAGLDSFLTTFPGAGHVPYVQNRTTILDQTQNFLYWEMELANAAQ